MIPLSLDQLADVVGGERPSAPAGAAPVTSVAIDSRQVSTGALFVPLAGEHLDGHDYVTPAVERGAAGYLWAQERGSPPDPGRAVVVDDPGDALLGLGWWLRDEIDPLVVAITGSVGKTTTKDLIAAAVAAGRRTVAGLGSHNNELGVPLTCARLEADSEVLVVEVGSRGLGHIEALAGPLRPDLAVVTAVGASHLEMLGDVETVARAKAELVQALTSDGVAVLNADDARVAAMAEKAPGPVVFYGESERADWRALGVTHDELARHRFVVTPPGGANNRESHPQLKVKLSVPGRHNVGNALAALAVAARCGVDPAAAAGALAHATISSWRMQIVTSPTGITVLNDAYNANPESMRAALATLSALATAGRRWAVLGQMAELGASGPHAHAEIGRRCAELGLDGLVVVGGAAAVLASAARAAGFAGELLEVDDAAAAVVALRARLRPGDVVLVKASRSVALEVVADGLVSAT